MADEDAGLQIFDLSNPTSPSLLSSTNIGSGEAIVVKGSVNGVLAYVSTGGSLRIVDVSNPLSPILRGQTFNKQRLCLFISFVRQLPICRRLGGNLEIIDVSNASTPLDVGKAPGISFVSAVAAANGYIYAISQLAYDGFYIFSPSGSSLTLLGQKQSVTSTGYNLLVSGTKAYVAGGQAGFEIFDVSNPYGPLLSSSFTDFGIFRGYNSVAVTGNSMVACGYPRETLLV